MRRFWVVPYINSKDRFHAEIEPAEKNIAHVFPYRTINCEKIYHGPILEKRGLRTTEIIRPFTELDYVFYHSED